MSRGRRDRLGPARRKCGGGHLRDPGRRSRVDRSIERQAWALLRAQLAPVGWSVKTPWQCLRGVVQGSAEAPGRVAAAVSAWSEVALLGAVEANERWPGLRASARRETSSRPGSCCDGYTPSPRMAQVESQ
jgi:hypothetical protein